MSQTEQEPKKRASLSPPAPPKRQPRPAPDEEEEGEQSAVAEIKDKLEDAAQAISEAYELLDQLEE